MVKKRFWKNIPRAMCKIPLTKKCQAALYYMRKRNRLAQIEYLVDDDGNMLVNDNGDYLIS